MSPPRVMGEARWTYFRHPGTDRASLAETDDGFLLSGRARLRFPEGLTRVTYSISCDSGWKPRTARIDVARGREKGFLDIAVSPDQQWTINGFPRRELRGYTDLDLSASPSTNTLAIRRLNLAVGDLAEIRTAWVVFPDLEVRPVTQRYHRLTEDHYRYEGLHNGFVAEFDMDDIGFVARYPGFWERVPLPRTARRERPPASRRRRT